MEFMSSPIQDTKSQLLYLTTHNVSLEDPRWFSGFAMHLSSRFEKKNQPAFLGNILLTKVCIIEIVVQYIIFS